MSLILNLTAADARARADQAQSLSNDQNLKRLITFVTKQISEAVKLGLYSCDISIPICQKTSQINANILQKSKTVKKIDFYFSPQIIDIIKKEGFVVSKKMGRSTNLLEAAVLNISWETE